MTDIVIPHSVRHARPWGQDTIGGERGRWLCNHPVCLCLVIGWVFVSIPMTRDAFVPMLAALVAGRAAGGGLAQMVADLPARFTASDRLTEIPPEKSADFLARLGGNMAHCADFLAPLGTVAACDCTDGLRMTLTNGRIVHLRASGNAPEFRVYTEAETAAEAAVLLASSLALVRAAL
mgnify:CR=1 FL=1